MKSKLVIFDNDGVLVDSEALIKEALKNTVANLYQTDISVSWAIQNVQGRKPFDTFQTIADHYGIANIDVELACDAYIKEAVTLFHSSLKPMAHIDATLAELQLQGVKFCIATGGGLPQTYTKMEITDLEKYFPKEHIFSSSQVKNGKPAPDLFLFAADNMGFDPKDCIVIEDSPLGIQGAKSAGMRAIGFTGGSHATLLENDYKALLENAGADAVIDNHTDLIETLKA